jgi:CheY-like chemotaxis protein
MNVLLIDDDPILVMVCTRLMKITDFSNSVLVAKEGREALDLLKKVLAAEEQVKPQLILLDINMPVLNGWDFLKEYVVLMDQLRMEIPVFMLSSTIDQADFDKAKTYDIVKGFFSKPLTRENLNEIKETLG